MIQWRRGRVVDVVRRWRGTVELTVAVAGGDGQHHVVAALAYPELVGEPRVGTLVLLNTSALALRLGTGGHALVVALPEDLPPDRPLGSDGAAGHVVKARYTPLQATVCAVDEPGSPHHATIVAASDLGGAAVVVADLHSALGAVLAGVRAQDPELRVAYVMTDGAALPIWLSRSVAALGEAGWLTGTVTAGQAYGGDLEAVSLHTGLLAARHVLGADIVLVSQGPGNAGTDTPWGFSGVAVGEAVNAVAALGGCPVAAVRMSAADARSRHRGVSHHTITALTKVALAQADVVVPALTGRAGEAVRSGDLERRVDEQLDDLARVHRVVRVDADDLYGGFATVPGGLSSMGRSPAQDPLYFLAAAAAGRHAARLARRQG